MLLYILKSSFNNKLTTCVQYTTSTTRCQPDEDFFPLLISPPKKRVVFFPERQWMQLIIYIQTLGRVGNTDSRPRLKLEELESIFTENEKRSKTFQTLFENKKCVCETFRWGSKKRVVETGTLSGFRQNAQNRVREQQACCVCCDPPSSRPGVIAPPPPPGLGPGSGSRRWSSWTGSRSSPSDSGFWPGPSGRRTPARCGSTCWGWSAPEDRRKVVIHI